MSGWSAVHALNPLPALYVALLALAGAWALRRWFDPVPGRVMALFGVYAAVLLAPVLVGDAVLLPVGVLRLHVPYLALPASGPPAIPLQRDQVHQIAPWQLEVKRSLLAGRWPLWNAHQGAGMPLLADPQAQALQPLAALAYPFSIWTAAGVCAALKILTALVFTFLLLRRQGMGEAAATAGASAFGLSGFILLWLGWPIATCGALLPAMLYALVRCDQSGRRRDLLLLAAVTTALILGGHPETLAFVFGGALAFLADRCRSRAGRADRGAGAERSWWRHGAGLAVRCGLAMLLGTLLAAPVLLPTLAFLPTTQRSAVVRYRLAPVSLPLLWHDVAQPAGLALWRRYAAERLTPVVAPNALGDQFTAYRGESNYIQDTGSFAGSIALMFALPAFWSLFAADRLRRRFPQERWAGAMLALSLALMAQPPGFDSLAARLPLIGMTAAHRHQRIQVWAVFCLSYLAACQIERWRRGQVRARTLALGGAGALALIVAAYLLNADPAPHASPWDFRTPWLALQVAALAAGAACIALAASARRRARPFAEAAAGAPSGASSGTSMTTPGGTDASAAHRGQPAWRTNAVRWAPWGVAAIVAGELLALYLPANPPNDARLAFPRLPAIRFLQSHAGDGERIVGAPTVLSANFAAVYGLADVRVDDPAGPFDYQRATGFLDHGILEPLFGRFGHPLYDFLGVRYIMTRPGVGLPFQRVFADASAWIYERPHPLDLLSLPERAASGDEGWESWLEANPDFGYRALLAPGPDPGVERHWRAAAPDASSLGEAIAVQPTWVHAQAARAEPRLLAAGIYQDGGWRVLAGGRPVAPERVDGAFVGAWLPAGRGAVDLLYRPPAHLAGCLLAAAALAAGTAWWVRPPHRALSRSDSR